MTIILIVAAAIAVLALFGLGLRLFDGSRERPLPAEDQAAIDHLRRLREELHHDHAPAFLAAPVLAPANRDLWPERRTSPPPWPPEVALPHGQGGDQPVAGPSGDNPVPATGTPGPAPPQPPPRGDGPAAAAVTAGPGDLAAAASAIKHLSLDDYEAALPGYADPVGAYTDLMAEVTS